MLQLVCFSWFVIDSDINLLELKEYRAFRSSHFVATAVFTSKMLAQAELNTKNK